MEEIKTNLANIVSEAESALQQLPKRHRLRPLLDFTVRIGKRLIAKNDELIAADS